MGERHHNCIPFCVFVWTTWKTTFLAQMVAFNAFMHENMYKVGNHLIDISNLYIIVFSCLVVIFYFTLRDELALEIIRRHRFMAMFIVGLLVTCRYKFREFYKVCISQAHHQHNSKFDTQCFYTINHFFI